MPPSEQPDRIHVAFDDHRLVANAGLLLPVTLAHHLGLGELVDNNVDLGDAPGRANAGDKFLTLVASALAGGPPVADIDDADALRAGETEQVLGCVIKGHPRWEPSCGVSGGGPRAPAGPGEPGVAGPSLARWSGTWRWAVDHRPGPTLCETFGLAKEGAQRHNYSGQRGYHPLLAVAAGTGEVLMA